MNQYTILCSEEQASKALALGAPIGKKIMEYSVCTQPSSGYEESFLEETGELIIPTAEQMRGWLRGKGYHTESSRIGQDKFVPICVVGKTDIADEIVYSSYEEALLSAINSALYHLKKKKD